MEQDDDLYSFRSGSGFSTSTADRQYTSMGSSIFTSSNSGFRPVTSTRAAGYTSRGRTSMGKVRMAQTKTPESIEPTSIPSKVKGMELKIKGLVDKSCHLNRQAQHQLALESAKEAVQLEKQAAKLVEKLAANSATDQVLPTVSAELTFLGQFNLALCYQSCGMFSDALQVYSNILKTKTFPNAEKVRVNMGNVYLQLKDYSNALKMYRMTLDQLPPNAKNMRLKLIKNIGLANIKLGQFQDAINAYEAVLESSNDHQAAFNLLLCYHAAGDTEKVQSTFLKMSKLDYKVIDPSEQEKFNLKAISEKLESTNELKKEDSVARIPQDRLYDLSRSKRKATDRYLMIAAKLVAKILESSKQVPNGFDWIVNAIKEGPFANLAPEIEIAKAIGYLKTKSFSKAIDTFKSFENKEISIVATASTNLSFLYLLEQDLSNALKYANVAIEMDKFNSRALTNKGNIFYAQQNYQEAKKCYFDAIAVDHMCIEAVYNLGITIVTQGLIHKISREKEEALECFEKLFQWIPDSPDVIYQIATIHEAEGNDEKALEWFNILISVIPTDPTVLSHMGEICVRQGDKSQAFHYYSESWRYFPANVQVMTWLGAYYVDCDMYEQALTYFKHAARIDRKNVKWPLSVASCLRKTGLAMQALQLLKSTFEKFSTSAECLKLLVATAKDLGLDTVEYQHKLSKLETIKVAPIKKETPIQPTQEPIEWNEDIENLL